MNKRFPPLDTDAKQQARILGEIARRCRAEQLFDLNIRLKDLKTESLKRSISWRNVSPEYAQTCEMCSGSGHYHFCIDPYCYSDNPFECDDCVHFTPDELGKLESIHEDYIKLLASISASIRDGTLPKEFLGKADAVAPKSWN